MTVRNMHERRLDCPASEAGHLIDALSSSDDRLWPNEDWPAMRFDRPLGVGAQGGHGPIGYHVSGYRPARSVRFTFDGPRGFDGYHQFEVLPTGPNTCVMRHTLSMTVRGPARVTWPLVFRPLHDALIEDSLHKAQVQLGSTQAGRPVWGTYVHMLRAGVRRLVKPPVLQPAHVA